MAEPALPATRDAGLASGVEPRRKRRWLRGIARIAEIGLILIATGTLVLWCSIPRTSQLARRNPSSTAFIDLRREQAANAGRPFELKWQWRPLHEISRYLRAAVVHAEDRRFFHHDGIDWDAIEHAIDANLESGRLEIGGSTITQQLAKNLYLSPRRSFVRKLREMLIAYSLEDHLSKPRILELYLNVVEWGDGVFGAEAAARHWFAHSARSLTPAEAIRLAIALPAPLARSPGVRTPALTRKAIRLTRLLRIQGLIDEAQERTTLDAFGAHNVKTLPSRRPPRALVPLDAGTPAAPAAAPPTEPPPSLDATPLAEPLDMPVPQPPESRPQPPSRESR